VTKIFSGLLHASHINGGGILEYLRVWYKFHSLPKSHWFPTILRCVLLFFPWLDNPREPKNYFQCWGFEITLKQTTVGRTSPDRRSAYRRELYVTTHNIHKKQTSMPTARIEPGIPASEWPQTHVLDSTATGIGCILLIVPSLALWRRKCMCIILKYSVRTSQRTQRFLYKHQSIPSIWISQ
jgi:hypothetical protein